MRGFSFPSNNNSFSSCVYDEMMVVNEWNGDMQQRALILTKHKNENHADINMCIFSSVNKCDMKIYDDNTLASSLLAYKAVLLNMIPIIVRR